MTTLESFRLQKNVKEYLTFLSTSQPENIIINLAKRLSKTKNENDIKRTIYSFFDIIFNVKIEEDIMKYSLKNFFIELKNDPLYGEIYVTKAERKKREISEKFYSYIRCQSPLYDSVTFGPVLNKPEFYSIRGMVQSGKTREQIHLMSKSILNNQKVIMVCNNRKDEKNQIQNAIIHFEKNLALWRIEAGIDKSDFSFNVGDIEQRSSWMNKEGKTNVLVLIGNGIQLRKLLDDQDFVDIKFNLFIDEADKNFNSKETESSDKSFAPALEQLVELSERVFCISATTLGVLFKKDIPLKPQNILTLPVTEEYYGLEKLVIHYIDNEKDIAPRYAMSSKNSIYDIDGFILKHLTRLSEELPFENMSHPRISLIKNSIYNIHHKEIMRTIICDMFDKFATIIYDGGVTYLHFHLLKKISYKYDKDIYRKNKTEGWFESNKGVHIQRTISFLQNNFSIKEMPRILIISGRMADRGINFTSLDYKWHLTSEYFRPSHATTADDMVQSLRILGKQSSEDNTVRSLYITLRDFDDIKKAYYTQEMVYKKSEETYNQILHNQEEGKKMVYDLLKELKICKENLPKRSVTKIPNPIKKVNKKIEEDFYKTNEENQETYDIEFNRLRTVMFPKWSKDTSKIALFMQELDPHKIYTEIEFKNYCKKKDIKIPNQVMTINTGTNGFGTIIKKTNNKYHLYPELIEDFEKNFNS